MEIEGGAQDIGTDDSSSNEPLSEGRFSLRDAILQAQSELESTPEAGAKDQPSPSESQAQADPQEAIAPETEGATEPADEAASHIDLPPGWKEEDKDLYAALPDSVREVISTREKERNDYLTKRGKDIANIERDYGALDQVLEPFRQQYRLSGATDAQAVAQAMAITQEIMRNPTGALQWIAQTYGVQLPQAQAQDEPDMPADHELQRVQQELHAVKQALSGMNQISQQAHTSQIIQSVEHFRAAKDPSGKLLHPHFDAARSRMAQLANAGVSNDINELYRIAVAADPTISAAEAKRQEGIEQLRRQKSKAAEAERARKASASTGIRSRPSTAPVRERPGNIFDAVAMASRELQQ